MPENKKLKVAFLWHMHQPFYLNPENNQFMMPWVRLHGLKDYLDMPLLAARYNLKLTFNLVPSLLDQIEMYCRGYTDRHLDLSRIPARELSFDERKEILRTFFSAHYPTMISPYPRYRQLYRKQESCGTDINLAVEIFSTSEWRDLQMWSNLVWIDPMFRKEEPVAEFFRKGRDFTEPEKEHLLDYEIGLLGRIIPTYQKLFREGRIDVSFTPYYHPILPLLIDTDSAREAISDISLPQERFRRPEDARWHVRKSAEKFRSLFGTELKGMWPSEGSVSEETLTLLAENNIRWTATDQGILQYSLIKSGLDPRKYSPHCLYSYKNAPELRLFFRDHGLSDKIGFVYSGWEADRAVNDFISGLKDLRRILEKNPDSYVVPVIMDGENAWEYYTEDGSEFLNKLYSALVSDKQIAIVSFSEAAESLEPINLPSVFAGSWINHNFRIWIGHGEDNAAWDALYGARKALEEYQKENPDADENRLKKAWEQFYVAEGSDWCWWYGDDHIGPFNSEFDRLYRLHLSSIYRLLDAEPPSELLLPIHRGKLKSFVSMPESLITPELDGLLTHYYEWTGAGQYDCSSAGVAMHRIDRALRSIYFAFDHDCFYIRLDFEKEFDLVGKNNYRVVFDFGASGSKEILLEGRANKDTGNFAYACDQILEVRLDRKDLAEAGSGQIKFSVMLYLANELIEKWPIDEPISLELPGRGEMLFWEV